MVATTMMLSSLAGSSSRLTARYASWQQGRGGEELSTRAAASLGVEYAGLQRV